MLWSEGFILAFCTGKFFPSGISWTQIPVVETVSKLTNNNFVRLLLFFQWQYDQIVKCTKGLDDIARLRTYRWYRPPCSINEDPRAWWLYAISCLYPGGQPSLCRPKPTWDTSLTRAKQNVQYVNVYVKILTTPSVALTSDEKKLKDAVEWERDFDDLKALREVAMRKAKPMVVRNGNGGGQEGRSVLVRWFPQWIGW